MYPSEGRWCGDHFEGGCVGGACSGCSPGMCLCHGACVDLASDRWVRRYQIDGLPVVYVYPGLPADKAGIISAYRGSRGEVVLGDVITRVNDREIRSNNDYLEALEQFKPGDTVTIETRRGKKKKKHRVKLVESQ